MTFPWLSVLGLGMLCCLDLCFDVLNKSFSFDVFKSFSFDVFKSFSFDVFKSFIPVEWMFVMD